MHCSRAYCQSERNQNVKRLVCFSVLALLLLSCDPGHVSVSEKARKIHEEVLTVDSHTDSPFYLLRGGFDLNQRYDIKDNGSRLDFPRMREGGLDAVFFAAFASQKERTDEGNLKAFTKVNTTIDSIHAHLARNPETAALALNPSDARKFERDGRRSIFIGIENGYAIGNDLGNIAYFYQKGARYITLCHTRNNDICDSSTDTLGFNGLSEFGKEVVMEMNRTGMMIDVSHISDSSFYDVISITCTPVIASYSCARAVCDNPSHLNDGMLRIAFQALRAKYNNIENLTPELEAMAWKEWDELDLLFPRKLATIADMVDHIDHIVEVAGINHVGIGTDFDGGGGLSDCADVSQLGDITLELVRRGYSKNDIRKIWGENLMRVMREVQAARQ